MPGRRAAVLPWRRGDQWGATSATLAGQERAAPAFERTARRLTLGVAASIKYAHQVLFFLPITALATLAIATAMPSDGRLCSRQKQLQLFRHFTLAATLRCSKHKICTPSFVLFAGNGIDHPCHSYGYAFGWSALFSAKITATFPTFYACCNAVRNGRSRARSTGRSEGRGAAAAREGRRADGRTMKYIHGSPRPAAKPRAGDEINRLTSTTGHPPRASARRRRPERPRPGAQIALKTNVIFITQKCLFPDFYH